MHTSYTVRQSPMSIFGLQNVSLHQHADFISQSIDGTNIKFNLFSFLLFFCYTILYLGLNSSKPPLFAVFFYADANKL